MSKNEGGQAFPRAGNKTYLPRDGMSLRDWFAGQALAGIMVQEGIMDEARSYVVREAYYIADAMLKERAKE